VAHPNFRHGRRSKYLKHLPRGLGAAYKAALAGPKLLSLKDDLALLEARQIELLKGADESPGPAWVEVRELIQEKTRTAAAEWKRVKDLQG
jgi:hypothetical protein